MRIGKKIFFLILFLSVCLAPIKTRAYIDDVGGTIEAATMESETKDTKKGYSFAVISDTPEGDTATQGEALINSITFLNEKKPDFIILLGDLTANGKNAEFATFNEVFLKKIDAPVVPVAGNHDFVGGPKNWYNFWKTQNSKVLLQYKSKLSCGTEKPAPRFYRFLYQGQGFDLIDPYFNDHKYGLTQSELDCIDSKVEAGDFVFRHVTPYGLTCQQNGSICGSSVMGITSGGLKDIDQLPNKLIAKNVGALFAGHTHGYYHGRCNGLEYINNGTLGLRAREYVKGWTAEDIADSFTWVDVSAEGKIDVTIYVYDSSSKTFDTPAKSFPTTVTSQLTQSDHDNEMEGVNATCISIQPEGATSGLQPLKIFKPILEINIPQLKFSDVSNTLDAQGNIHLPYIGEYISTVYKFLMVVVSIIAIIMIIVAGVKITTIGGEERIKSFQRIGQIVIGLFIAWGSYAILYNINPDLINFDVLKVFYIQPQDTPEYEEPPSDIKVGAASNKGDGAIITKLIGSFPATLKKCTVEAANYTADALTNKQICVGPLHCAYTASNFLEYIGCTNIYALSASKFEAALDAAGWSAQTIRSKKQFATLPFGLLAMPGHVGISLGKGFQFDSGSNIKVINKKSGKDCAENVLDFYKNPSSCDYCSLIPEEAPRTKHYAKVDPSNPPPPNKIPHNQGWLKQDAKESWRSSPDRDTWQIIQVPPSLASKITPSPKKPCVVTGTTISENLCAMLGFGRKKTDWQAFKNAHPSL